MIFSDDELTLVELTESCLDLSRKCNSLEHVKDSGEDFQKAMTSYEVKAKELMYFLVLDQLNLDDYAEQLTECQRLIGEFKREQGVIDVTPYLRECLCEDGLKNMLVDILSDILIMSGEFMANVRLSDMVNALY